MTLVERESRGIMNYLKKGGLELCSQEKSAILSKNSFFSQLSGADSILARLTRNIESFGQSTLVLEMNFVQALRQFSTAIHY